MAVSKQTQALIDQAVAEALAQAANANTEANKNLVDAASKPELQGALRSTWRKERVHLVEQVQRFLRLAFLAAAPSLIDLFNGGKFDQKTLIAFAVPVLEVAYRQMFPALGAKGVDDAQGVTIVPEQVGVETPPEEKEPPV